MERHGCREGRRNLPGQGSGLRVLRWNERAIIAAGLVILALLALWFSLPGLLAARWTAQLRSLGYPQAELAIDDLHWGRAVGAFSLGGEEGADRFDADFTPAGLWRGRLTGLTIRGLRLSHPLSLSSPGLPGDLPLDGPVFFQDARLLVDLPGAVASLPLTLDAGFTPLPEGWHGEGRGILSLGPTGVPARFSADWRAGDVSAASFAFDPTAGGPRLSGQGSIRRLANGGWTGEMDVTAAGLPNDLPDLSLQWREGRGQALLDWRGVARGEMLLDPDEEGSKRLNARLRVMDIAGFARRLGRPDPGLTGGPLELTLTAQGFTLEALPQVWPDMVMRLNARAIGVAKGPRDNALTLGGILRRIDGNWWLSPVPDAPGSALLPTLGLEARGVQVSGRLALPLDLDLRAANLRLPWLAPSSLTAKLRGEPGADLRLEWNAATLEGGARLSGGLDLDPAGGRLLARLAPITLMPGNAVTLFPGAPLPWGMEGIVAGRLSATWTGDEVDSSAELLLEQAGFEMPGLRVAGINGVLRFDRLSPLSMPAQRIAIGLFDPGLALRDGALGLSLPGDGVLRLAPEPFLWAGACAGIVPTSFRLGNDRLMLRIDMPATPLSAVLDALALEGLNGEGSVIGSLPIQIDDTGAHPLDGALRSAGPGRLFLSSGQWPVWLNPARNDSLALVTRALADYRYDALELSLAGGGTRLSLKGKNPTLYGGYPMPMNLVLSPPPQAAPGDVPAEFRDAITAFKARKD